MLNTNEDDDTLDELHDHAEVFTDDDEENLICEKKLNADNSPLCKTKAAHDAMLGKTDASLAMKTLTATETPHLDTRALITKPDDVAKTVDLNICTILAEQTNDRVLGIVPSWLLEGISPNAKTPETQKSKRLLRFCQEFDRHLIDKGQLLGYNEPSDKLED